MNIHSIHEKRIHLFNDIQIADFRDGPVVYWMNRDMRISDNWALLHAQNIASQNKKPLVVVYNLELGFLGGTMRSHDFKVKSLKVCHEKAKEKNMTFCVVIGRETSGLLLEFFKKVKPCAIVTDFSPLNISKKWQGIILDKYMQPNNVYFAEVDAHNIVPARYVTDKQEFAARTIRPKLHRLLSEFLIEVPKLKKHTYILLENERRGMLRKYSFESSGVLKKELLSKKYTKDLRQDVAPIDWCEAGEDAALTHLQSFLKNKFKAYAEKRNDPNAGGQSNLSAYLHYGNISAQRIALEVIKIAKKPITVILESDRNGAATENNASAFLEELIVRRELSDNFCLYNENYDNSKGLANWAKLTLLEHASDKREYVYTCEQWEAAETHDGLWNAAQNEMSLTGKMHGYMRMYWAKKILEWSKNLDDAIKTAIYLNDTYSVDGRDPNGYSGVLWSIGGLHDRAWFERPIYGKVRYMNANGCRRKFDVDAYIEKWSMGGGLF